MGIKGIIRSIPAKIGSMRCGKTGSSSCHSHQSSSHEEDSTGSHSTRNMLESTSFVFAYIGRFAKKTILDCFISIETLGSDDLGRPESAAHQSKSSSSESLESVKLGEGNAVVVDGNGRPHKLEKHGQGHEVLDVFENVLSEAESDGCVTGAHEGERKCYYHQLPCEEKQPTIEQGTVKRLGIILLPLFTGGLSNEEYLKTVSAGNTYGTPESL